MFDIAPTELLIVALVALVVIGPKDLPRVMRTVGQWVGRARGMARHFRSGIDTMIREAELEEMEKKWKAENERIMREFPTVPAADPVDARRTADDAAPDARPRPAPPPPAEDRPASCHERDRRNARAADGASGRAAAKRLIWSFVALGAAFGVCFYFAEPIFGFLVQPLI
jgi:sec-independent protein translocase protein TatB